MMIKCPKCGSGFELEESSYSYIVKQVRNEEFNNELNLRKKELEEIQHSKLELETNKLKSDLDKSLSSKEEEINKLKQELKTKEELTRLSVIKEYDDTLNEKKLEIENLKKEIEVNNVKHKLDIEKSISEKDKLISSLEEQIKNDKNNYLIKEANLKENYNNTIKAKDEQIEYYKDFKARQSTKMVGESLEVHCYNEFNKIRPMLPKAYFEKDNDIKTGSKGDFIFRDFGSDGIEIVSIMFEMKNECDTTSTKHKNEDFFKELDKDRREKNCEYAVLVSLLEIDNDYYNTGIVDVSYKYPKMYVIRPQFFIPLITLIRNLAFNSLEYRKELEEIKMQNIDITHFEDNLNNFKDAFGKNYTLASNKFKDAIEEIDKTIDHLEKVKSNLISSDRNLRLANDKVDNLSIKKLTSGNKTMKDMFEKLESEDTKKLKEADK